MTETQTQAPQQQVAEAPLREWPRMVTAAAEAYGVEAQQLWSTLKATVFKTPGRKGDPGRPASNAEMIALLAVAQKYELDPFTKQIYAFSDKGGGIIPIVGVDGWTAIMNRQPRYEGIDFEYGPMTQIDDDAKPAPEWIEAIVHISGRPRPIVAREWLDECYRPAFEGNGQNGKYKIPGPWQTHTKRMLRHKALIQGARMAFGVSGLHDDDEAGEIIDGTFQLEQQGLLQNLAAADGKTNAAAKLDAAVAARSTKGGKGKAAAAPKSDPPPAQEPAADQQAGAPDLGEDAGGGIAGQFEEVTEDGEVITREEPSAPIPPAGTRRAPMFDQ